MQGYSEMNRLVAKALELLPEAAICKMDAPALTLIRIDEATDSRVPVIYEPCIYFVLQGSKSALLKTEEYIYDAMNYLVLSVPLPLHSKVLQASKDKPYLAVRISIDTQQITELVQESKPEKNVGITAQTGIFVSRIEVELLSALSRLLDVINKPDQARVLGKLLVKELLFHVLQGPQGEQLRSFAYRDRQNFQVARAIGYIHENYAKNIEVAVLAEKANMSQSSFHAYFKTITRSSPIQYLKAIRLHAARRIMIHDSLSASDAAYNVGYASPSQFSREYRRLFGVSPSVDVRAEILRTGT